MIKIENTEVYGWKAAIRGMRNPLNSWEKSDSSFLPVYTDTPSGSVPDIGYNDHTLMLKLAKGGSTHAKYRRMITVTVDITAPLYWWKEFDTYKIGTVANSCSTMHKIHEKPFTLDDFSFDHLLPGSIGVLEHVIDSLNRCLDMYLDTKDKLYWWQMIQLLPTSYNQKRTILLNYEVLVGMYRDRRNHKLDEWHDFCDWITQLPYSDIVMCDTL